MTQIHSPHYVISAKAEEVLVQQTRMRAASAVVLAQSWVAAGHTEVQIIDPAGDSIRPDGYRRAIMSGLKLYR